MLAMQTTDAPNDPVFTPEELARDKKLHPATIRKLFVDQPGVIRLGHSHARGRRQYYTLRADAKTTYRVHLAWAVGLDCSQHYVHDGLRAHSALRQLRRKLEK